MGEGDWHITALTILFNMLRHHYRGQDAYVAADMMVYYEEGNPRAVRAPDVMVCMGVSSHQRPSWLTWVEGVVPAVVFEIASPSNKGNDLGPKKAIYERIGVGEYFAFDPIGDVLTEERGRLRGWRLVNDRYEPIEPDDHGNMDSLLLNMHLYIEGTELRLVDLETRLPLKTYDEMANFSEREVRRFRELGKSLRRRFRRKVRRLEVATTGALAEAEAERRKLLDEVERLKAMLDRRDQSTNT